MWEPGELAYTFHAFWENKNCPLLLEPDGKDSHVWRIIISEHVLSSRGVCFKFGKIKNRARGCFFKLEIEFYTFPSTFARVCVYFNRHLKRECEAKRKGEP